MALWSAGCGTGKPAVSSPEPATDTAPKHITLSVPPLFADETNRLKHEVAVRNDTGRPVRFTAVRRSCTCTDSTLDAMELAPDQETTLHFDIDLRNRSGPQRFVCGLARASGSDWTYTLETTVYERARFLCQPAYHFGTVDPNAEETHATEFWVYGADEASVPAEVDFRIDSERVRLAPQPPAVERLGDGVVVRKFPLQLHLKAASHAGPEQTNVTARFRLRGEERKVQTGVGWSVRTLFEISPPQAFFGTLQPGSEAPVERRVLIRRADRKPLRVKEVKSSRPWVRATLEEHPEASAVWLVLKLDPKSVTETAWGEVVVETNHPVQTLVKVPLAAVRK